MAYTNDRAKCIYKIESADGKQYIGCTVSFEDRKYEHLRNLRKGCHHSKYLQNYYNKNGEFNLKFSIIYLLQDHEDLVAKEQELIDFLKPVFNMNRIAGLPPNLKGRKYSKEHCANISKGKKGYKASKEKLINQSRTSGRRKITDEQALEIAELLKTKSGRSVAKMYNVSNQVTRDIKNKKTFKYLWEIFATEE